MAHVLAAHTHSSRRAGKAGELLGSLDGCWAAGTGQAACCQLHKTGAQHSSPVSLQVCQATDLASHRCVRQLIWGPRKPSPLTWKTASFSTTTTHWASVWKAWNASIPMSPPMGCPSPPTAEQSTSVPLRRSWMTSLPATRPLLEAQMPSSERGTRSRHTASWTASATSLGPRISSAVFSL